MIRFSKPLSFGLIIVLLQLIMIFNSSYFFGEKFAEEYSSPMFGYLVFFLAFFPTLLDNPLMKISAVNAIPYFAIFLFIGVAISMLPGMSMFQVNLSPNEDPQFIKGVMCYQIIFVANTEEAIFRSILPTLLPSIFVLGIKISSKILSNIVFGFFHLGTYFFLSSTTGQSLTVLVITAILAGLAFQAITEKFGIAAAMGAHSGINIANLGVL